MTSFHFAPVQGHTDAAYRHFHSQLYPGPLTYYTPFIRLEKGTIRPRDLKDLKSDLNENLHLVPQIIFRDQKELNKLVAILQESGMKEIDLNMGCPFPLQTGHGRGAATIANEELAREVAECVQSNPDIEFSVKMRLGLTEPEEWKKLLPHLNSVKLKHITLHPRVAKQQYGGDLYLDQFEEFLKESRNPVVFNGDLKTPEEVKALVAKYPAISGVMIARGALGRPSIFSELISNENWSQEKRIEKMKAFHNLLFKHYQSVLCGDSQVISKIKPFWEYSEDEIGRKAWKALKKAVNLAKYQTALARI